MVNQETNSDIRRYGRFAALGCEVFREFCYGCALIFGYTNEFFDRIFRAFIHDVAHLIFRIPFRSV